MPETEQSADREWGIPQDGDRTFERHVRAIFDGSSIGMSMADAQGRILECNPALSRILGYSRDELRSMTFADVTHPDDRGPDLDLYQELLRGNSDHYQVEKRYIAKDGRVIWTRVSAALVGGLDGAPATIRMIENISDERTARQILQQYEQIMENIRDIILVIDGHGAIIEANQAAVAAYGYSYEQLLTMTIEQLRHPSSLHELQFQLSRAREGTLFETLHQHRDGSVIPVEVSSKWTTIGEREVYLSVIRDVSERKRAEAEIRSLNQYDKLTGFHNRTYFEELMRHYDRDAMLPISLIIGDVNGLKQINSALGDEWGDQILTMAADAVRAACGDDVLASRWGDDEYAILLVNTGESEALRLCEQIQLACTQVDRGPVLPNLALGSATKRHVGESLQELCQTAEERMYRNKFLDQESPRSYFISSLTRTLRERNLETEEHAQRLEQLAVRLGNAMGLSTDKLDELRLLAALHDIGKVGIPDDILLKAGPLTPTEWKTMKTHSEIGYRIAELTPDLVPIARAILTHHERWNGKGYPLGLEEEEIPLIARIISIVDTYDVMTHDRPYKLAVSHDEAMLEIARSAGSQFDPRLVEAFFRMFNEDLYDTARGRIG